MESTHPEEVDFSKILYQLFGSTRAEWLGEHLYELFAAPRYFPELKANRPCFLEGGRGTGKTTALKGLSYEGQSALNPSSNPRDWEFFGLYHRVDTNRVTALSGDELTDEKWSRLFGHYLNLTFTQSLIAFLGWFENKTQSKVTLPDDELELVARSLGMPGHLSELSELGRRLRIALADFEASINNVADGIPSGLSLLGAPIDQLIGGLRRLPLFEGKVFFFLIDEYENYLPYQQRVVNTLVKHSSDAYTFKVGVRQLGWKIRSTLNSDEQLMYPADYALIEVEERLKGEYFKSFATEVCQGRLNLLAQRLGTDAIAARDLLPGLSEEAEAQLLGIDSLIQTMRHDLAAMGEPIEELQQIPNLLAYLILFWSKSHGTSLASEVRDFKEDPLKWQTRFQNYKHTLLYTIRRGRRGIRKYYSGWDTLLLISNSNIRYALELVYECLRHSFEEQQQALHPVSPSIQTIAAQSVGERALKELEGVSIYGAQLTKLVLGLGRVFSVMASDPGAHAPEVNQFYLGDGASNPTPRQIGLLDSAVMHLALVRSSGTKLIEQAATRDYDYWLHPVFAPFFVYSYRQKRKMQLDLGSLEGLVDNPRQTIRRILASTSRSIDDDLPEQLTMFEGYYASPRQ